MSAILIPVDFSEACRNAYRFGLHLAKDLDHDVVLTHYYSGSLDPRDNLSLGHDGTVQGGHEDRLRRFAYSADAAPGAIAVEPPTGVNVHFETDVSLTPSAAIAQRAEQSDIALVIMAPRSSASMLEKWLGSTTTTVSEVSRRPVLIVPPDARYRPVREVVIADNGDQDRTYPLAFLDSFPAVRSARLHFVRIDREAKGKRTRFTPWRSILPTDRQTFPALDRFTTVHVNDRDISRGLVEYAARAGADLIVILNRKRPWWRALLEVSLTQDLALRSRFPTLVLHAPEEVPVTKKNKQPAEKQ